MKILKPIFLLFLWTLIVCMISPCALAAQPVEVSDRVLCSSLDADDMAYEGIDFVEINSNRPDFYIWQTELPADPAIYLSQFDDLGRTGPGYAVLGPETISNEPRGQIGNIQPTGWQTIRYDDLIADKYLYNRCHVIGYQLCGDNNTPENLFTGTRHLNVSVMIHFEDRVAKYIELTGNHVLYRVSPVYVDEDDLVCFGVQMEAYSIEDSGELQFNVLCFNEQPGILIDYQTGNSERDSNYTMSLLTLDGGEEDLNNVTRGVTGEMPTPTPKPTATPKPIATPAPVRATGTSYVLNTNTHKFHYSCCSSVGDIKASNRWDYTGTRDEVIAMGYQPCKRCNP